MTKVYIAVDELWAILNEYKERNIEWGVPYLMNAGINQAIMALNRLAEKNGKKIVQFLNESGISAYDLCRIGRDLCCCRTCKYFVQHFGENGKEVDFGHCNKNAILKGVRPNNKSCGFWTLD